MKASVDHFLAPFVLAIDVSKSKTLLSHFPLVNRKSMRRFPALKTSFFFFAAATPAGSIFFDKMSRRFNRNRNKGYRLVVNQSAKDFWVINILCVSVYDASSGGYN